MGGSQHVQITPSEKVPERYLPRSLSTTDKNRQKKYLIKSRKLYKKGIYYNRPQVKSFKSKPSSHIENARRMYSVKNVRPSRELARKTKCSLKTLKKIVKKGEGAYLSSGSRPNQTPQSWGFARLASAITKGNASVIDYGLLKEGCKPESKALKLAKSLCHKTNKCKKYTMKKRTG
jgi:hypothetical protein